MSMDRFDRAVVEKWGDAWPFAVEVAAMIRSFVSSCGDCHHTTESPRLRDEIAGLKAECEDLALQLSKGTGAELRAESAEKVAELESIGIRYAKADKQVASLRAKLEAAKEIIETKSASIAELGERADKLAQELAEAEMANGLMLVDFKKEKSRADALAAELVGATENWHIAIAQNGEWFEKWKDLRAQLAAAGERERGLRELIQDIRTWARKVGEETFLCDWEYSGRMDKALVTPPAPKNPDAEEKP